MRKFLESPEAGNLAPIGAVSFLWSEAEQKDLAETGVCSELIVLLQNFNINIFTYGT